MIIISGYPIVFESLSVDLGDFFERVRPGAVDRLLRGSDDLPALWNHDTRLVIGRRSARTLELAKDDTGLGIALKVDTDISYVSDLVRVIERRDAVGGAFGFRVVEDFWYRQGDRVMRDLIDVDVYEVSLGVTLPAYQGTKFQISKRQAPSTTAAPRSATTTTTTPRRRTVAFAEKERHIQKLREADTRIRLVRAR